MGKNNLERIRSEHHQKRLCSRVPWRATIKILSDKVTQSLRKGQYLTLTNRIHGRSIGIDTSSYARTEGGFLLSHFCSQKALREVQTNYEPPSRPLNLSIRYKKFWMETIYSVNNLLQKEVFMATLDLRDAYLHIPIRKECQKFLRMAIQIESKTYFQCRALPFGLSSSQRIFSKVPGSTGSLETPVGISHTISGRPTPHGPFKESTLSRQS